MMLFNLTLAVEFIALGFGVAFLIWAYRTKGVGSALGKVVGYVITIAIVFLLACSLFHGFKFMGKKGGGYYGANAPGYMFKKGMGPGGPPPGAQRLKRLQQ